MSMRVLSMSATWRWHSSARRIPVEYSVINMAQWNRLLAESMSSNCFFLSQDERQFARRSRIGHFFEWIVPLQRLAEEEPQRRNVIADRSRPLLPIVE